jgi:predicted Zn-dependent peptidase
VEDRAQPILLVGYHRPANTHPDDAALNALADYLGEGRTSVLYKKLVKEDKIAVQAFAAATFIGGKYPDIFLAGAVPAQGVTAQECEKVILEQIEKVKEAPISAEELKNIKARAKARFTNQLDSRQGMAMQLAAYETMYGDWRAMFRELDKINAVTVEDIQRVARAYLTRTNRTVAYIETVEES